VTSAVTAVERRRDRVALGLFAAGALLYLVAFVGLHRMATVPSDVVPGHAVRDFTRLWLLSRLGMLIALIGGVAMLWSFWRWHSRPKDVI